MSTASSNRFAVRLQCPGGDWFGEVETPPGTAPGTIFLYKRCRNRRCRVDGTVTFHAFDGVTGACQSWHVPVRTPEELAARRSKEQTE